MSGLHDLEIYKRELASYMPQSSGAHLIGASGIVGITPTNKQDGEGSNLQAMLEGLRDYTQSFVSGGSGLGLAVLLSPNTSTRNRIQPTAGTYPALTLRKHTSQTVALAQWEDSAGTVGGYISPNLNIVFENNLGIKGVPASTERNLISRSGSVVLVGDSSELSELRLHSSSEIQFYINNSIGARFDSNKYLLINQGVSLGGYYLQIRGSQAFTDSGDTSIDLLSDYRLNVRSGGQLLLYSGNGALSARDMLFRAATASRYRFQSFDGTVDFFNIGNNGALTLHLTPNLNASYDLGSSGNRYRHLHLSGDLYTYAIPANAVAYSNGSQVLSGDSTGLRYDSGRLSVGAAPALSTSATFTVRGNMRAQTEFLGVVDTLTDYQAGFIRADGPGLSEMRLWFINTDVIDYRIGRVALANTGYNGYDQIKGTTLSSAERYVQVGDRTNASGLALYGGSDARFRLVAEDASSNNGIFALIHTASETYFGHINDNLTLKRRYFSFYPGADYIVMNQRITTNSSYNTALYNGEASGTPYMQFNDGAMRMHYLTQGAAQFATNLLGDTAKFWVTMAGRNTWNASSSTKEPAIYSWYNGGSGSTPTTLTEYVMLHLPHIPYLQNGYADVSGLASNIEGSLIRFAGNRNAGDNWDIGHAHNISGSFFMIRRNGSNSSYFGIDNSGRVGINTNAPSTRLAVVGDVSVIGTNQSLRCYGIGDALATNREALYMSHNGAGTGYFDLVANGSGSANQIEFRIAGSWHLALELDKIRLAKPLRLDDTELAITGNTTHSPATPSIHVWSVSADGYTLTLGTTGVTDNQRVTVYNSDANYIYVAEATGGSHYLAQYTAVDLQYVSGFGWFKIGN